MTELGQIYRHKLSGMRGEAIAKGVDPAARIEAPGAPPLLGARPQTQLRLDPVHVEGTAEAEADRGNAGLAHDLRWHWDDELDVA